jgi:hypothetical protein
VRPAALIAPSSPASLITNITAVADDASVAGPAPPSPLPGTTPKLGIGIEETNAGIGILASMISVRYRNKKNAGLHQLSPVLDRFWHR